MTSTPKYICGRCGFGTDLKYVLKNHITKTKPCDFNIADLNKDELMESYIKLAQKSTQFKCEQCNKYYATQITLDKHKLSYCKMNKNEDLQVQVPMKILNQILEKMNDLCSKTTTINNNNTINNTTINLKCFFNPSISHLEKDFLTECFINQDVPTVIENVYCRSDVPENKSIKIDNDGKIKVYDDGKWKRDTIKEISIQGFRILSGHWRENRHIIDDNTRIWMEDVSSGDKYVLDKMTRDTNSILIKHKDYFQMAE